MAATMIQVGRIVGAFGLEGWVKVQPTTDFPERFNRGARLFVSPESEPRQIQGVHWHKEQARIKLRGIDTVEQAEALIGRFVEVPDDQRPTLREDEYYTRDLIGLAVFDESGEQLGLVEHVVKSPAQDLLVVEEMLIPVAKEFVREVDLEGRRIVVRLIPGMRPGEEVEEV